MKITEAIQIILDARLAKQGAEEAARAFDKVDQSGRKMKTGLEQTGVAFDKTGREARELGKEVVEAERRINRLGTTAGRSANPIRSLFIGFAGIEAIRRSIRTIAELEDGILAISKTTGITGAALQELDDGIASIAARVPIATTQLLDIGAAAGQLGVTGKQNLEAFVETVGRLGLTSDLQGSEAATTLARLLNVTGESFANVTSVGNVITRLGNEFAATESEIASVATRIAQTTAAFGVSSDEALAFGATLRSLGVEAELAGGTFGRAFREIDKTVRTGGEGLENLADIAGVTSDQFAQLFQGDAVAGFTTFLTGLQGIGESGGSTAAALESVGIAASRDIGVLQTLSRRADELGRALGTASDELEAQSALFQESDTRAESLSSKYQLLKNSISNVIDNTGESALLGGLKFLTDGLTEAINRIGGLTDETPDASLAVEGLASAINALGTSLAFAFGASQLAKLKEGVGVLAALRGATLGPAGLIGGAIGLGLFAIPDLINPFSQGRPRQEPNVDPLEDISGRVAELEKRSTLAASAASTAATDELRLQFREQQLAAARSLQKGLQDAIINLQDSDVGRIDQASIEKIFGDSTKEFVADLQKRYFDAFADAVESGDVNQILSAGRSIADFTPPRELVQLDLGLNPLEISFSDLVQGRAGARGLSGEDRDSFIREQAAIIQRRIQSGNGFGVLPQRDDVVSRLGDEAQRASLEVKDLTGNVDDLRRSVDSGSSKPIELVEIERLLGGLEEQISLFGKTEEQIRRLALTRQFDKLAAEEQNGGLDDQRQKLTQLIDKLEETEAAQRRLESLGGLASDAFSTIANGFAEGALQGEKFLDILENIGLQLSRLALQRVINQAADALFNGITAAGSSAGGGFGQSGTAAGAPSGFGSGFSAPLSVSITQNIGTGGGGAALGANIARSTRQGVDDAFRLLNSR